MSTIAKDFFGTSPVLGFALLAMALFMAVFVAVTLRVLLQKNAGVESASRLPLEDGIRREQSHE